MEVADADRQVLFALHFFAVEEPVVSFSGGAAARPPKLVVV